MKKQQLPKSIDFLSSHGLTIICLVLLMIITIIGTIAQKSLGLFQSQKIYFESFYFIIKLFKAKGYVFFMPLPGGYLILLVLFFNLAFAFIFKFRFRKQTIGIIVCHIGLLLLMLGSYLTYAYSIGGHLSFYEKEAKNHFVSYNYNEILVTESQGVTEKQATFKNNFLAKNMNILVPSKKIHFNIKKFYKNCQWFNNKQPGLNGSSQRFFLKNMTPFPEDEANVAGLYIHVFSGKNKVGGYYVSQGFPTSFNYQGSKYTITIQKEKYDLPFSLELLDFTRVLHPNSQMPKHFESKVTLRETIDNIDKPERTIIIKMNQPLRYQGYTFYQSSFAQEKNNRGQITRERSTLAVMRNPAEKWPYISCLLVVLGMIVHFLPKLFRFAKRQSKKSTELSS